MGDVLSADNTAEIAWQGRPPVWMGRCSARSLCGAVKRHQEL